MNLDFLELHLQGFKCFTKNVTIPLAKKKTSEFVYLTGLNLVDEDLGANGAGKSSCSDGLCWVLYGKTPRNLKAGDVKNWYSKDKCIGSVLFRKGSEEYTLTRTWSPISLKISKGNNLEDIKQDTLDDLLGLNFEAFLYSVEFSQFKPMFFDLGAAEKSTIFSTILDLDRWNTRSDKAKDGTKSFKEELEEIDRDIWKLEAEIITLEAVNFDREIKSWDSMQDVILGEIMMDIKLQKKQAKHSRIEKEKLEEKLEIMNEEVKGYKEDLSDFREDFTKLTNKITKMEKDLAILESKTTSLEEEKNSLSRLDVTCPTCKQEVDSSVLKKYLKTLNSSIKNYLDDIANVKYDLDGLYSEKTELEKDGKNCRRDLDDYQAKQNAIIAKSMASESEERTANAELARLDINRRRKATEENPFIAREKETKSKIEDVNKDLTDSQADRSDAAAEMEATKYWVKGFKEIRLHLISQALKEFEIEVNSSLDYLGLSGWRISFETDKENGTKSVSKGFHTLIHSPQNKKPVRWEVWSGGESQRLRLAGTIGLSNLILSRAGIEPNLEIWDEPTHWLNDGGVQGLLETLLERSKSQRKGIWLIDHRSFDSGNFDRIITVVKGKNGSTLETRSFS